MAPLYASNQVDPLVFNLFVFWPVPSVLQESASELPLFFSQGWHFLMGNTVDMLEEYLSRLYFSCCLRNGGQAVPFCDQLSPWQKSCKTQRNWTSKFLVLFWHVLLCDSHVSHLTSRMHHHLLGKDPEDLFSKYIIRVVCSKTELLILADEAETKGKEVQLSVVWICWRNKSHFSIITSVVW